MIKKSFKILGILLLTLILFRGWIYRNMINYSETGSRENYKITSQKLKDKIESKITNIEELDINQIIHIANSITCKELEFTFKKATNNPNELIKSNKANCIGYSAMFNSITNYLIQKYQLNKKFVAEHKIGKMDFIGFDLHELSDNPFFKDHDFNSIKDLETKRKILIDPSVNDYLGINKEHSKKKTDKPKDANFICDGFYAKGQLKYDSYTFCSTVPKEIQYSYKEGKWTFWNIDGNQVAKGIFRHEKQKIENHGGCSYEVINSKIDRNQWIFWDNLGNTIEPSNKIVEKLESCTIKGKIYKQ